MSDAGRKPWEWSFYVKDMIEFARERMVRMGSVTLENYYQLSPTPLIRGQLNDDRNPCPC